MRLRWAVANADRREGVSSHGWTSQDGSDQPNGDERSRGSWQARRLGKPQATRVWLACRVLRIADFTDGQAQ